MQYTVSEKRKVYFSSWSRKGYAVFSALGKDIYIAPLALHMFGVVLLKSAHHGLIVSEASACVCPVRKEREGEREEPGLPSLQGSVRTDDNDRISGLRTGERDMVPARGRIPFFI